MSTFFKTAHLSVEDMGSPSGSIMQPETEGWLQRFRSSAGASGAVASADVPSGAAVASDRRKAIVYAKSSPTDASGASIDRQVEACTRYAMDNGMDVDAIDVYADELDRGCDVVGSRLLIDLMLRVRAGDVDAVVTGHPSHLARNMEDVVSLCRWLSAWGVELHSVANGLFGDAEVAGFISLERAFTERRSRTTGFVHRAMVKDGRVPWGGGRLFGYERDGHVGGRVKVREDEREIVLDVFRMARVGVSHAGIARILNEEGHLGRRGKPWVAVAIGGMLGNPLYRGNIVYGRERRRMDPNTLGVGVTAVPEADRQTGFAAHLVIVDDALWNDVQSRSHTKHGDRWPRRGRYPLTGLVRCPGCGAAMSGMGASGGRKDRFVCRARACGKSCDNRRSWDMAWVETATLGLLSRFLDEASADESYLRGLTEVAEKAEAEAAARRTEMERRLAALETDLVDICEAAKTAALAPPVVERIRAAKQAEYDRVAAALRTIAPRRGPIDVTARRAELSRLATALGRLAESGRIDVSSRVGTMLRIAIRPLIRRVVPTPIPGSRGVAVELVLEEMGLYDPGADVGEGPTRIVRGAYVPSGDRGRMSRTSEGIDADRRDRKRPRGIRRGRGLGGLPPGAARAHLIRLLARPDGATLEELQIGTGRSPAAIRRAIARLHGIGLRVAKAERPDGRTVWHAVPTAA